MEDPSLSTFPPLRQPVQSQNTCVAWQSDGSTDAGHTPKNAPLHRGAQPGVKMQSQTFQGSHMPNLSSTAMTPLWEMVEKPAMLASAELFLSQQQDNTPENAAKPVCDTGQEWMQHFDADPRSEPVTGVKGSSTPLAPQATRNLRSHIVAQSGSQMELHAPPDSNPPDQSSMTQNPVWVMALPSASAHLSSEQPNAAASLTLPSPPVPLHSSATLEDPALFRPHAVGGSFKDSFSPSPAPPLIDVVMATSHPISHDDLPDSEFEECDSVTTRSTSKPVPTNSAQFMHLRNSGETSLPTSSHKSYPSPNRAPTKNSKFDTQQPSVHGVLPWSPPVTSVATAAGRSGVCSLVDPHINVFGDRESQDTSQSVTEQSVVNSREQQLSFHRRQPTTTDCNSSINVPFHVQPTVVGLPPSKVPPMMETSAEASDSAATLVESGYEVDTTAAPASSKSIEQRLAVSSGGSSPDLSVLQEVQQQDPGYLGSNHFARSSVLHRHAGNMDPRGRIPMDSSRTGHDSEGIQIYMVT